MAIPPRPIQIGMSQADTYAVLNDNFNNAVQNLNDLGANTSSTITITLSVGAGAVSTATIGMVSSGSSTRANTVTTSSPVSAIAITQPQITVFVDGTDAAHRLQDPTSILTSGQNNVLASAFVDKNTAPDLADFILTVYNLDIATHTYTIKFNALYLPNTTGIFR